MILALRAEKRGSPYGDRQGFFPLNSVEFADEQRGSTPSQKRGGIRTLTHRKKFKSPSAAGVSTLDRGRPEHRFWERVASRNVQKEREPREASRPGAPSGGRAPGSKKARPGTRVRREKATELRQKKRRMPQGSEGKNSLRNVASTRRAALFTMREGSKK